MERCNLQTMLEWVKPRSASPPIGAGVLTSSLQVVFAPRPPSLSHEMMGLLVPEPRTTMPVLSLAAQT